MCVIFLFLIFIQIAHVIHFWCQILFFDVNQTIYVTKLFHTSRGFDTLGLLQTA